MRSSLSGLWRRSERASAPHNTAPNVTTGSHNITIFDYHSSFLAVNMDQKLAFFLAIALSVCANALGAQDRSKQPIAKKSEAFSTSPLTEFKKIVDECKNAFDGQSQQRTNQLKNNTKWNKTFSDPAKISYDVKQTDSLVSPYVAELIVEENSRWGQPVDTEEAARLIEDSAENAAAYTKSKIIWAYQDKAWATKSASATTIMKLRGKASSSEPLTYPIGKTNHYTTQPPIYSCFKSVDQQ